MTPTARVTPLPWKQSGQGIDGAIGLTWDVVSGYDGICNDADGTLIVAAVNAMFALNPSDPLAAAQHLEALVEMARTAVNCMDLELQLLGKGAKGWEVPRDALRDAIVNVTGKSS